MKKRATGKDVVVYPMAQTIYCVILRVSSDFSTRGAKAAWASTSPGAGCCCKAGTASHTKEGISSRKAAASLWLHRRDENTAFVLIKIGF